MVKLQELESVYRNRIRKNGINSVDDLIEVSISLYESIKVEKIDCTESYNDVLLFQYGFWDFSNGDGELFGFDITRQIIMPDDFEPYQLSMELVFKSINNIKPQEAWSNRFGSTEAFVEFIKASPGYQASIGSKIEALRLNFGQC